ncbi:hypothetical protein ACFUJT_28260 [Streptomyces griseoincarnatus]
MTRDATVVNEAVRAAWETCRPIDTTSPPSSSATSATPVSKSPRLRKDSNRRAHQVVDGSASGA